MLTLFLWNETNIKCWCYTTSMHAWRSESMWCIIHGVQSSFYGFFFFLFSSSGGGRSSSTDTQGTFASEQPNRRWVTLLQAVCWIYLSIEMLCCHIYLSWRPQMKAFTPPISFLVCYNIAALFFFMHTNKCWVCSHLFWFGLLWFLFQPKASHSHSEY